jgi:hypothetical protein
MSSSHGLARSGSLSVADLLPLQLGTFVGGGVLRIGDLVRIPTMFGELALAAFGRGSGQFGLRV